MTGATSVRFSVSINRLYPGEKLLQGDDRWGKFNGAFETEEHTPESLYEQVAMKGHAFCCALNGYRKAENFASAQLFALDFDSGDVGIDDLLTDSFIAQYATFIYPTISWTPDTPKWRVVFILTEVITEAETYRKAATALLHRYKTTDQHVKDPARLFFGTKPGNGESLFMGNVLPMAAVLKLFTDYEDYRRTLERESNRRQLPPVDPSRITGSTQEERYVSTVIEQEREWLSRQVEGTGERHNGLIIVAGRLESLRLSTWLSPEARGAIDPYAVALDAAQANRYIAKYGEASARRAIEWGINVAEPRPMPQDWGQHHQREGESGEGSGQNGFRLTSLSDLLREPEERLSYIWEQTLPFGGLSLVSAKPKVGKSTFARNLALAVAKGEPFMGRSTNQGPVVYLGLEDKRSEVASHFRRMGATTEPIFVYTGRTPEEALVALRAAVVEHRAILAIVDTLFKLVRIRDGNDYAEVTLKLEPLLALARETGCHVLAVHHNGKVERDGGDAILGSTALFGSVDTAIIMRRRSDMRTVESQQRYGQDLPKTALSFDVERGLVAASGTVEDIEMAHARQQVLEAIDNEVLAEQAIKEAVGGDTRWTQRAIRSLFADGLLERIGAGKKGDPYRYEKAHLLISANRGNEKNEKNENPDKGVI